MKELLTMNARSRFLRPPRLRLRSTHRTTHSGRRPTPLIETSILRSLTCQWEKRISRCTRSLRADAGWCFERRVKQVLTRDGDSHSLVKRSISQILYPTWESRSGYDFLLYRTKVGGNYVNACWTLWPMRPPSKPCAQMWYDRTCRNQRATTGSKWNLNVGDFESYKNKPTHDDPRFP